MRTLLAITFLLLSLPHVPRQRQWRLGGGFTAVAVERSAASGGPTTGTLEIRHGPSVRVRFRSQNQGLGVQAADITGDGVRDLLVLNYQDGTGACGSYRLYGGPDLHELWVRYECADFGVVRIAHGDLIAWTAILTTKTAASGADPHCCWSRWRQTTWQWQNGQLQPTSTRVTHEPPPSYQERLLPGAEWIR